jgi:hypothetical protein
VGGGIALNPGGRLGAVYHHAQDAINGLLLSDSDVLASRGVVAIHLQLERINPNAIASVPPESFDLSSPP